MKLGQVEHDGLGTRDACHCPGILAQASGFDPQPGDSVRFTDSSFEYFEEAFISNRHGIVDPFITNTIRPGDYVWVLLNPGVTKDLVHHFDLDLDSDDFNNSDCCGPPPDEDFGCRGCS